MGQFRGPEEAHEAYQVLSLAGQCVRRTRQLFCRGGIALRDLFHLSDSDIDLLDTGGLFIRGCCYFLNQFGGLLNGGHQLGEQRS